MGKGVVVVDAVVFAGVVVTGGAGVVVFEDEAGGAAAFEGLLGVAFCAWTAEIPATNVPDRTARNRANVLARCAARCADTNIEMGLSSSRTRLAKLLTTDDCHVAATAAMPLFLFILVLNLRGR